MERQFVSSNNESLDPVATALGSDTSPKFRALIIAGILALTTTLGGCVKRHFNRQVQTESSASTQSFTQRININTASSAELEKLPGIGKGLAARIIEHRDKYGPFRKPEHLIIVRGISDKRFHALEHLITVE